jgi:hypothetical protein
LRGNSRFSILEELAERPSNKTGQMTIALHGAEGNDAAFAHENALTPTIGVDPMPCA